jgi:hypothetical protein
MTSPRPALYTVAYPDIDADDRQRIDAFRSLHDAHARSVIGPHFTLLFACAEEDETAYRWHVQAAVEDTGVIPFCCRYAMLGATHHDESASIYLVPDEGFSQISLLHDRLYRGLMARHLRLDLPYLPHISIGMPGSGAAAKALCDEWNAAHGPIHGVIRSATIGAVQDGRFKNRATYMMRGAG